MLSPTRHSSNATHVRKNADNSPAPQGPTLLEALDAIETPKRPSDKPLRLPLQARVFPCASHTPNSRASCRPYLPQCLTSECGMNLLSGA